MDNYADKPDPRLLSRRTKHAMGGGLNEIAAAAPIASSFGSRMLAKFGWKEGEGLGKNKDGMKDHIRVTQRKDGLGLGADAVGPSEWAPPPAPVVPVRKPKDDDSDSDSDEAEAEAEAQVRRRIEGSGVIPGMSDEDLFKMCGGARLGMRARAKQNGKQARMEEADRQLKQKLAGGGGGSSSAAAAGPSSSSSKAQFSPRASPRLQAQAVAKAANAIPEMALDWSSGAGTAGSLSAADAAKASKKEKKEARKRKRESGGGGGEADDEEDKAAKEKKAEKAARKEAKKAAKKAAKKEAKKKAETA